MDCERCKEKPPLAEYKCKGCGAIPTEHPFPTIGCRCLSNTYVCNPCMDEVRVRIEEVP